MSTVSIPQDLDALVALLMEYRRQAGMSQKELADKLGTQQSAVSEWETGKSKPSGVSLFAIADVLGCRIALNGPEVVPAATPFLDLARRVTESQRVYAQLAEDAWRALDVTTAVRYRGMADGLRLTLGHHADVVAEQRERAAGGSDA